MRNAKVLQRKSMTHLVEQVAPGLFAVKSGETGNCYGVSRKNGGFRCSCPWGERHSLSGCSHTVAALRLLAAQEGRAVSVWASEGDARRQHRPIVALGDGLFVTHRGR